MEQMSVQETGDKSLYNLKMSTEEWKQRVKCQDTHGEVYSHRLSYLKVRIGGDFFYGKSDYENCIESI